MENIINCKLSSHASEHVLARAEHFEIKNKK